MKNTFLYLLLAGSTTLFSCGNQSQTKPPVGETGQQPDTTISGTKDYCFRQLTGKDTLSIRLHVEGDKVTGNMDNIPDQKDARHGNITGVIVGDEIKAVWHFSQEGMDDSMQVAFKLTEEALQQRPSTVNQSSGREEPDTKADYTINIPKVACE
ncbi:MAG: hypothetical protein WC756_04050 [Taibaiella sp.]|jgi:hypothetical protein